MTTLRPAFAAVFVPVFAIVLGTALALAFGAPLQGQGAPSAGAAPVFGPEVFASRPGVYIGTATCTNALCHGAAQARGEGSIRGDEHTVWLTDPHRLDPYRKLETAAAAAIVAAVAPGRRATELELCLGCHAIRAPAARRQGLELADGISCEGCHGPAGGWATSHYEEGRQRAESQRAGLVDLGDLRVRAALCGGCHLGDGDRAVDHRLIAAGHPVLQFELDNYTAALPRHWFLAGEGKKPREPSHGIRAWAVGQAEAMRASLGALAARARSGGPWPDFALLSCRSCHHDLAGGAWRGDPAYRFRDGLPPWSPARWAVLRHLLTATGAGDLDALDPAVAALAENLRTFGERQETAALAEGLERALAAAVPALLAARFDRQRTRALVHAIAGDADTRAAALGDVATAEQVALALQSLAGHLVGGDPGLLRGPLARQVGTLFDALEDPYAFDREAYAVALDAIAGAR